MDTAQGKPGDALEYTASSGGAAYIIGPAEESLVEIEATYSYVSDTPDFWRRPEQKYPEHGQRFTGEPAYFKHVETAGQGDAGRTRTQAGRFHLRRLSPAQSQVPAESWQRPWVSNLNRSKPGCSSPVIGNTYAGSSLIGLTAILDIAKPGDRILMVSYGSGAGSDAFSLIVTDKTRRTRRNWLPPPRITSPAAPRSITPSTRASATRSTWDKGRLP